MKHLNIVDLYCRGLFIISDKGIAKHASVNDVEVGRCVNEIHRLVVGFQYADKNGEGELYLDKTFCVDSLACGLHFWDFCHCHRIMEMIKNFV